MLLVGLTGGIGAGKSIVADRLRALSAWVIEADQVAREVVRPGSPGFAQVVAEFGETVVAADGSLDRSWLADLIFADDSARVRLNRIVHPLVRQRSAELIAEAPADAVVVYDVPLLVENDLAADDDIDYGIDYDVVVVVESPLDIRLKRLAQRGLSQSDAMARINTQASDAQRRAVADIVLVNDSTIDALYEHVDRLWAHLRKVSN